MLTIKRVTDFAELEGIRKLQEENLRKYLSDEVAAKEGFVTAEYSIEFLKLMHESCASIIAKDNGELVGYALVSVKSIGHHHPLLAELFNAIETLHYKNKLLKECNYVVVGQLCVAKNYRGIGLAQQMYQQFKNALAEEFDYCITDVASNNQRSLKAHIKTGFEIIDSVNYGGIGWDIVLWDWTK